MGWRPHSRRMRISHDGRYWYKGVSPKPDQKIPRYWNSFWKYERSKKLPISIEINIATTTNDGRISALGLQGNHCALTGIPFQFHGADADKNLLPSLDRIDSDGHYEAGNLQVVCQFINFWKGSGDKEDFRRLLTLVRGEEAVE